jgi:polynucleotide 5'-hydroxyl-kinase GRC3/NOL9
MRIEDYPEWRETIESLAETGGTTLILGGTDTGKTTFCTLLANATLERGERVAIVDADIGQSEIGPPGCVSLGLPDAPVAALSQIPPARFAFVGATSPRHHLLEHAVAVRQMCDCARSSQPFLLLIDTTGMIQGPAARRLKQSKLTLLQPDHVVAIQQKAECEALLSPLRFSDAAKVHRLPIASVIRKKTPALRAQRRAGRFALYFQNAETRLFQFDEVAMSGTWLNGGSPLPTPQRKTLISLLGVNVFYAEMCDRHLGVITNVMPRDQDHYGLIQEQFRQQALTITPAAKLRHLLIGLADQNGRTVALGTLESLNFRTREIGIFTPLRAASAVKLLQFGIVRVKPDGTEVGANLPGDV